MVFLKVCPRLGEHLIARAQRSIGGFTIMDYPPAKPPLEPGLPRLALSTNGFWLAVRHKSIWTMPKKAPRLNPEAVRQHIEVQSRQPFREFLCEVLQARPSVEAIREFATKRPDRWAHMCSTMAKLAGYSPKNIVEGNVFVQINQMSDSQLNIEYRKLIENISSEDK